MASWLPCPRRATEVFGAARETATGKMPIQDGALPPKHGALGVKIWHLAPCWAVFGREKQVKSRPKTGQNLPQTGAKARLRVASGSTEKKKKKREGKKMEGKKNVPPEGGVREGERN